MQQSGFVALLQEYVRSGDENIEQFATGCLINLRSTILRAAAEQGEGSVFVAPAAAGTAPSLC